MSVLLLLGAFVGALVLEIPVVFAMLGAALIVLYADGGFTPSIVAQRMAPGLDSFPLLAVPLFVLAGNLLVHSGVARQIFDFARCLVGHIRGGFGHVIVVSNVVMSGMSGVGQADAAALGQIGVAEMKRRGYTVDFAAAVCSASAVLGPLIPPSVLMVLYSAQTNILLTDLFLAGMVPGLVLALFYMGLIYVLAASGRIAAPLLPRSSFAELASTFAAALPALAAPIFLIVGLLVGFATPTELGGLVVAYAIVLGVVRRELTFAHLWKSAEDTAITCGVLVFIIASAVPFSWIIAVAGVPSAIAGTVASMELSGISLMLIINVALLMAGMVLETAAILLIAVPILAPLVSLSGLDPLQFAMIVIFNLIIGTMTPPFGVLLFVLMDIAKLSLARISRAVVPFYIPLIVMLLMLVLVPGLSLWLPQAVR